MLVDKGADKATNDIITGYKSDVLHIINGSKSTKYGHAWELLFDGKSLLLNK